MKWTQKIAQNLDMPAEVTQGLSKVEILGGGSVQIENFKGILEYSAKTVRVKTNEHTISIIGDGLEICEITDENIQIKGVISRVCL